jgi:hypothetical protein
MEGSSTPHRLTTSKEKPIQTAGIIYNLREQTRSLIVSR